VEYGSDYPPYGSGGPDLGGVPGDANGLSAGLMGLGWPRVFNWYNALAWERDWRDCSLGGSDCTYGVDRADYVYYSGHGSNGTIYMPSNNHDSSWVDATKARFQNARWVGFSSCLTLRAQGTAGAEPIRQWFNSFQGSHMLLGFNTVMGDVAFGPLLVDNMRLPTLSIPLIGTLEFSLGTAHHRGGLGADGLPDERRQTSLYLCNQRQCKSCWKQTSQSDRCTAAPSFPG